MTPRKVDGLWLAIVGLITIMLIIIIANDADAAPRSKRNTVLRTHATVCPKVVEYTVCSSLTVTAKDFGATGWSASTTPSTGSVRYNLHYIVSWPNVVAHEVGGHVDAWNEIVRKVGTAQAWTDYYDLDYFGERFFEARFGRDISRTLGKELYLDCAGPVAHGYTGSYISRYGSTLSAQTSACSGTGQIMTDALTKSRP